MKTNKLFGDFKFYKHLMAIAIPIMLQNGITNFVNMLDNIMVGQIGTDQMSGVAIINQLIFVFNLCIFGGISGAGIFTAQFFGQQNHEGVRYTFRFKVIISMIISAIGMAVFFFFGENLINQYIHSNGSTGNAEATLHYAKLYLAVMFFDLIPFALSQSYAGTLRECNDTLLPMKAGIAAVFINLVFNYLLIYGKFGFPTLGVVGAAIATVLSRVIEMLIIIIYTHTHTQRHPFIVGAYKSIHIPAHLLKNIIIKGTPLLFNESLWSAGQTILLQNYSIRGLEVIAALNISSTISNVFNIVFISMGSATAIILGQELGEGRKEVKEDAYKLAVFAVLACVLTGSLLYYVAPLFPMFYNTEDSVKQLATYFIMISACCMPMYAYENAAYFTIRSGGKTFITFLFDSCFVWVCSIPLAYVLTHYTALPILTIFICCQAIELIKCAIGFFMVKSGFWINQIT
ncbi:MAG: MATE family efflux transporter [Butyrivibrio sp.]|jgi:putative MATE family efflux protein|nr:MATE family efflux transporter [Butyrivibrio sp.]